MADTLSLTINLSGHGTAAPTPDKELYSEEDAVSVAATVTGKGWKFKGFTGDFSSDKTPLAFDFPATDTTIQAEFEPCGRWAVFHGSGKLIPHRHNGQMLELYGQRFYPNGKPVALSWAFQTAAGLDVEEDLIAIVKALRIDYGLEIMKPFYIDQPPA